MEVGREDVTGYRAGRCEVRHYSLGKSALTGQQLRDISCLR